MQNQSTRFDVQTLTDHGFLVFHSHFTEIQIQPILSLIQNTISTIYPTSYPTTAEEANPWVSAKSKLQQSKDILDLVNTNLISHIKKKLDLTIQPVKSCQIASRFPQEGTTPQSWHIDNFTEKDLHRKFIPKEFDYLIGIYLTSNETDNAGNFTCYPGAHHQVRSYCRSLNTDINSVNNHFITNGLTKIREQLKFHTEFQVKCKIGSVIFVDRMLPHLICSPNLSSNIRTIIFFRAKLVNHNLSTLFFGPNPHIKTTFANEIELKGYGYLKSPTVYRIKPRLSLNLPNAFGSMVEIIYDTNLTSIHTTGFLSKESHTKWLNKLQTFSLPEIVEQINNVDYQTLIEEFHPFELSPTTTDLETITLEFHHIHSLSKSAMISSWHNSIIVTRGEPGIITFTADKQTSEIILKRILSLHWNKKPKITRILL